MKNSPALFEIAAIIAFAACAVIGVAGISRTVSQIGSKSNVVGDYQGVVVEAIEQENEPQEWPDGSGRVNPKSITYWSLVKIDDGRKVLVLGQREVGEKLLVREYADSGFSSIR